MTDKLNSVPAKVNPAESDAEIVENGIQPGIHTRRAGLRWRTVVESIGTYLLALVLALIVWLVAINEQNPLVFNRYPVEIPIEIRGPDEGLITTQDLTDRSLELYLRAPSRSWEAMNFRSDFSAYVDLTNLEAGEHIVTVETDQVDPRINIVEKNPSEYTVLLEEVKSISVPVRVSITGEPAAGYQVLDAISNTTEATVTGRSGQISQISHVAGTVQLTGTERSQVEMRLPLTAISSQNATLQGTTIDPEFVSVIVPIEQTPGRKEVAVRPALEGEPATGYRLSALRVEPSSVTLVGDPDLLTEVPGSVATSSFSLDGATADFARPVGLILPEGVTTLEGRNTVVVSATIAAIESGKTITLAPIIDGLDPDYTAEVGLDAVDVIISGPVALLDSLEADDLFVILDLSGLVAGVHNVQPQVVLPSGVSRDAIIPETVEVVITRKAEGGTPVNGEAAFGTPDAAAAPTANP
ncbi:MAG: hypothetical protein KDD92_13380 [Caldilineaceae bacterium]|nr:hypothetical protein [Caldilineaceae bacterium]